MPRYIVCLEEGIFLSERRHEAAWMAITELVCEMLPNKANILKNWSKPHVASKQEASTWLEAFFKVKEYKPESPGFDVAKYYTPMGYDTRKIAKELGVKPEKAAIMVRKLERALMLSLAEEILGALRHSYEFGHKIKLTK